MKDLIKWYDEKKGKMHPVELAAKFHHKFTYIHPFIDGNGRTARLLTNLILMRNGYPISVIKMENREEYMKSLEKASTENDYDDFIKIIEDAVYSSLETYLYILG